MCLAVKHILDQISTWQNANCVTWGTYFIILRFCFLKRRMEMMVPSYSVGVMIN